MTLRTIMALLLLGIAWTSGAARATPAFVLHDSPKPLPEVHFIDAEGHWRSLADFRGRVVLLNLWATWCVPCRKEMPTLDRLQATLGGPGFEVVPLSIDIAGPPVVRKFYEETGVTHLGLYIDPSTKAARDLAALGLPTTLLVDREGREVGRLTGPAEWDSPEMISFLRDQIGRASAAVSGERPNPAGATLSRKESKP